MDEWTGDFDGSSRECVSRVQVGCGGCRGSRGQGGGGKMKNGVRIVTIRSECSDRAEPRGEYRRSQQFICQTSWGTSVYRQCNMPRHHVCSQPTCIIYSKSQPAAHHSAQVHSQISIRYMLSWH